MDKVVRIFGSFEEADESDDRARRAMTPEERVEIFLELQQGALPNGLMKGSSEFVG